MAPEDAVRGCEACTLNDGDSLDWASATLCSARADHGALAVASDAGVPLALALRCPSDAVGDRLAKILDVQHDVRQDEFERNTDAGSAALYFHYYGMLQHQQNMLQDYVRTGTYWAAITENTADFAGKTVVDVGAGSGILSLFAAQAGASRVYAVEASDMANHAAALCAANPGVGARVSVVRARVESAGLPPRCADVLVSEPMGTLLLNERMLESYVRARDTLLKPGGRMFPALGRIHVAAFSDAALHAELDAKAAFWRQPDFYGVNLGCLERPAADGFFRQVVVDAVPAGCLVSGPETKVIDFGSVTVVELQRVVVPLRLVVAAVGDVHGVAAWFDVLFDGSTSQRWLSTAPGLPTTHWFQLRCVLQRPLRVTRPGVLLEGELVLEAHERQSYWVHLSLSAPPAAPGQAVQQERATYDLKDPYYRQLTAWAAAGGDAGAAAGGDAWAWAAQAGPRRGADAATDGEGAPGTGI